MPSAQGLRARPQSVKHELTEAKPRRQRRPGLSLRTALVSALLLLNPSLSHEA